MSPYPAVCLMSLLTILQETKIKGYINILGYRVTVDEALNPGKYGFKIDHEQDKTHYFSHEEKSVMREWMKAIMKATIGRDYSRKFVVFGLSYLGANAVQDLSSLL